MAAARSPSPNPSRPSSPNPNSIETSSTSRKNGTFNLSKSWSSSEIPHRKPGSKSASPLSSPRASFEKENERESNSYKPARTRPVAINSSKGTKSFMAPTISAASKITAASPRKKILSERNQVVRESTESNSFLAEEVKEEGEMRRKSEIDMGSEELSGQNRPRKLDYSSSKDHHRFVSHSLDNGPSDVGPSLPPYDPMKNYLSPRPRFLHYRPNQRIEQHQELREDLLYAADARRLEDSFSDSEDSDDFSDIVEDDTSMKTHEVVVSDEIRVPKSASRSIGRSKFISFVSVLIIVSFCIPLTDSPLLSPLKMKDQSFSGIRVPAFGFVEDFHFYDYLDITSKNLQILADKMRQLSVNSIKKFPFSGSFSKEPDMFHSFNMTISSSLIQNEDLDSCFYSGLKLAEKKNVINGENNMDIKEIEFRLDKTDLETLARNVGDVVEKVNVELSDEEETFTDDDRDFAENIFEFSDEEDNHSKYEIFNPIANSVVKFETMTTNVQPEKIEGIDVELYPVGFNITRKVEEEVLTESEPVNEPVNEEDIDSSAHAVVELNMTKKKDFEPVLNILTKLQHFITSWKNSIFAAVLGILAATSLFFLFMKQKKSIPVAAENKSLYQKTISVPDETLNPNSYRHANRDVYCSQWGLTEMMSDSGPTEMSSSFNNSLLFRKHWSEIGRNPGTPSPEITQRRESGVSSSSISYGSFTSFEKRSGRKGLKDEEVMTPVRRSSRIRKSQVSPP